MGNPSKWEWSTNKETAAQLLAEDSLSIPQIAQQLGASESTVDRWRKVPEFQARIKENIAAFRTKFLECGLARKESRLAALTDVYHRLQLIVSERGASAEMKSVAGGASGLIKVPVFDELFNKAAGDSLDSSEPAPSMARVARCLPPPQELPIERGCSRRL